MTVRRSVQAAGVGLCLGAIAWLLVLTSWGHEVEQDLGLGWLFALRGARAAPADVVVAAIDHDASRRLGLPNDPAKWPRDMHARLVDGLARAGVSVVAFDLFFGQPAAHDDVLARALADGDNVVLSGFLRRRIVTGPGDASAIVDDVLPPVASLAAAARAVAPFPLPKSNARVDGFWTFIDADGRPTFPVAALQVHASRGHDSAAPHAPTRAHSDGEFALLDFYGPPRTIRTISYDALVGTDDVAAALREGLRGKAVFVGFSESAQPEQKDNYYTVFSQQSGLDLSGVEIAATAFGNMLEHRSIRPLGTLALLGLLVAWGVLIALACEHLRPASAAVALAALVAAYVAAAVHGFAAHAQWWPLVVPLCIQAPLGFGWSAAWKHYRAQKDRDHIRRVFQHYLPGHVVDELARDVGRVASGQKLVYGTCLATDAENFTTVSEQMDPVQLGELMNAYYQTLFAPVERHDGVVADVKGDAMLAIWATPKPDSGMTARACTAALEIVDALVEFNRASGHPALHTRIGLDCGAMALGSIGAIHHYEYTAMGDMVNTAHRIESLNKRLATQVLVSEAVAKCATRHLVRGVGAFVLQGRSSPTTVYELMRPLDRATDDERWMCDAFTHALDRYRGGDTKAAAAAFRAILERAPTDGPSRFYLNVCERPDPATVRPAARGVVHLIGK